MYCEMPSRPTLIGTGIGDPSADIVSLCAGLHDGMHAMAQPLTLLRSYFHLVQTDGGLRSQLLLDDAAAGVEQLCSLFQIMQELVHVQSAVAQMSPVPFCLVLASLLEDAEVVFAGTGLQLDLREGLLSEGRLVGEALRVKVDAKRTRQALISMLHVARQGVGRGSAVSCSLALAAGFVEVRLEREEALGRSSEQLDEVARLQLALANAYMVSQQAVFRVERSPLRLSIGLPIAGDQA